MRSKNRCVYSFHSRRTSPFRSDGDVQVRGWVMSSHAEFPRVRGPWHSGTRAARLFFGSRVVGCGKNFELPPPTCTSPARSCAGGGTRTRACATDPHHSVRSFSPIAIPTETGGVPSDVVKPLWVSMAHARRQPLRDPRSCSGYILPEARFFFPIERNSFHSPPHNT